MYLFYLNIFLGDTGIHLNKMVPNLPFFALSNLNVSKIRTPPPSHKIQIILIFLKINFIALKILKGIATVTRRAASITSHFLTYEMCIS